MLRRLLLLLSLTSIASAEPARPPEQPKTGPGGADYRHEAVRRSLHGEGGKEYWLFEPQEPAPAKAPLIIFLHGFSVMDPHGYMGWIEHLARRGNVVVYPRYQGSLLTRPADFHPNTISAIKAAMLTLAEAGRVAPDIERVAAVGHSAGAVLAIRYSAAAAEEGLPVPKAAVIVQPGQGPKNGVAVLTLPAAGQLPEDLRFVVAVGDTDYIVADGSARRIWRETAALKHRVYVTVQTDLHGEPRLRAGHLSPMAADLELADAHDWFGWWRLLDGACDAAFAGQPLRFDPAMGQWSDGQPVKPLKIEADGGL
jgi:poly(3-hydroxybutyrate) depolymerase